MFSYRAWKMPGKKRVAVVGAGISGIVAVKSCLEEGLEPVCFEQFDKIGGLWYYTEEYRENQGARAFDNLTSNVCKDMFAFSDFPFSPDCPAYLTCSTVSEYISAYCEKFQLMNYIQLNTTVTKVRKSRDYDVSGRWEVETTCNNQMRRETFDFVIVCSGFYKKARYPNIKGLKTFNGSIDHSQTFKNGQKYKEKRVLVVGNSNSSGDLTAAVSDFADQVYYSVGCGTYLMPRFGPRGIPWDFTIMRRSNFFTTSRANRCLSDYCNNYFDLKKAGLSPSTPPLTSRVVINDEIRIRILNGKVKVVGQLVRIGQNEAEFSDGTVVENLDAILFATGYEMCFEFMEDRLTDGDNKLSLYKMLFPLQLPQNTLALIGLMNAGGAVPPVSELQSRFVTQVFAKKCHLPSRQTMTEEVDRCNTRVLEAFGRYKYRFPYLAYNDELATAIGVTPSWWELIKAGPRLAYLYYFGPAFPYFYRLWGPHSWDRAREAIDNALEQGYYTKQPRAAPTWNNGK